MTSFEQEISAITAGTLVGLGLLAAGAVWPLALFAGLSLAGALLNAARSDKK